MTAFRSRLTAYSLLFPGTFWLVVFFVVPLYFMAKLSLDVEIPGTLHYEFVWHWANYKEALELYDTQFFRSFEYAAIATLLCLVIAFKAGKWRNLLLFAVVAPFFTTSLIRTLAWKTILADESPVTEIFHAIGLAPSGHILYTSFAVIAGITYNFLPFMVLPLYASLERIDVRVLEAAKDLYANSGTTFWKVTLPLSLPGVVAGTLLTFIPAVGDYVNAEFLGGVNNRMIGNVIQSLYLTQNDYSAAAALSFVLMAVIMVVVFVYIRFAGSEALMGQEAV